MTPFREPRFCRLDLFTNKCRCAALAILIFPVPVSLNLFFAPLCVLVFIENKLEYDYFSSALTAGPEVVGPDCATEVPAGASIIIN